MNLPQYVTKNGSGYRVSRSFHGYTYNLGTFKAIEQAERVAELASDQIYMECMERERLDWVKSPKKIIQKSS